MRDYFHEALPTRFLFPIDGDCIDRNDGTDGTVRASVQAAPGSCILVNGVPVTEQNGVFTADVALKPGKNLLTASNTADGSEDRITVFVFPNASGVYRISSDDNILFLCDINQNKDVYTSIFDNPYLAVYKKAHDLYGAKVHLNLFYAFNNESAKCFSTERPDFDLSMMTDKFKQEWEANADWLTLSFHARAEFPGKPYRTAPTEVVLADFEDVRREVIRFAGEKTFSHDVTTIHWGELTKEAAIALRKLGGTTFTGYFYLNEHGECVVSYYAPPSLATHVGGRDFWHDTETDITFGCIDRVINVGAKETVLEDVKKAAADPHCGGFVSIMIHEQYFYPDYVRHLPDFEERVLESAKYLFEKGYKGSFVKQMLHLPENSK